MGIVKEKEYWDVTLTSVAFGNRNSTFPSGIMLMRTSAYLATITNELGLSGGGSATLSKLIERKRVNPKS
ncbi:MAG: hypothetical protein PXY39_12630 [archaeon]|nr:hypothetical protein [archaeon]